jgi:cobalt-zinc-cadmium efflux system outer membrane protein
VSNAVLACALALALAVPVAEAGEPPQDAQLHWADVVSAVDRDPRVASARARTRAAQAAVDAAGVPPNPELEAELSRVREPEGGAGRGTEWSVGISIPLDWLARRGPEVDAARAGAAEAGAEAQVLRAEVLAELWGLFVRAASAQAEVQTLEETERQVDALTRLVVRRVQAGEARPVEVPRVELELERVRNDLAGARATRDGAFAQLRAWLGVPVARVDAPPALPAPELPAATATEAHPRVKAALSRAAAARADAAAARRARLPSLSVGAFYSNELDAESVGGRVTVELPLWNWKGGQLRRAEAAAESERARADAETRAVGALFADAAASCEGAQAIAERHQNAILPRAEASARTLERTFQLGETGLLDVIDARRVLLEARREVLSSARDRDAACGALILLSGRELP